MYKSIKYKLKVSAAVEARFVTTLDVCRELYNAALQERRDAYRMRGVSLKFYDQSKQLPPLKAVRPDVAGVYSQVLQDVLLRLDKTFTRFFRWVKSGKKAGYPRFKSARRYNTFTYTRDGFKLTGNKLRLSKIGSCRVRLSRPVPPGTIKACTIHREADGWYVFFLVECEPRTDIPMTGKTVGLDVGLENLATLSTGETIENPRFYGKAERRLKTAHRNVRRKKSNSNRRKKAVKLLAKQYLKVRRQRRDFFHKASLDLLRRFDQIAIEDLNIKGMIRHPRLGKMIRDAAWGTFFFILGCKAAEAGKRVIKVIPNGTSQECSDCGALTLKKLSTRIHHCSNCGLKIHRDHNASINIDKRAGAPPAGMVTGSRAV